jgi:hypothetical protein
VHGLSEIVTFSCSRNIVQRRKVIVGHKKRGMSYDLKLHLSCLLFSVKSYLICSQSDIDPLCLLLELKTA